MTITTDARTDIIRLVVGMFDAAPGADYLSALSAQFESGVPLTTMAVQLSNSAHFTNIYAASLSNEQFVDLFLANVLDNEVAAGPTAWAQSTLINMLDAGVNRGEAILRAVQELAKVQVSDVDWGNAKAAFDNQVAVATYYSVSARQSSTSLATLQGVISNVSSDDATVAAATTAIDAAITLEARSDLIRLYIGMFDAAPGANQLATLAAQFESGVSLATIAADLASTASFTSIYPASLSDEQFVDLFLANLLENETAAGPTAWATDYLMDMLAAGTNRGVAILTAVEALDNLSADNTAWADAKAALENQEAVATYYSVTKAQSSTSFAVLQDVIDDVSSDDASVATAKAAIDEAIAASAPEPEPEPVVGSTFDLTAAADTFTGNAADDVFNATYDAAVTDTLNADDIISGLGGMDTLNIAHHLGDAAITPPDALWTGVNGIEKVVMTTTGNGEQTITTGVNFEAAFAAAGVDFTTTTLGSGAIDITSTTYTGAVDFTTSSLAGAQTIMTGSGNTTVNASSTGGALHIEGAGLIGVVAVTTGAGAQTIISTSTSAVSVQATTAGGALAIVTGTGNDTIILFSTDVAGVNSITGNAGADSITLVAGTFAAPETIIIGNTDSGITLATADSIVNFETGSDQLKLGIAGDATVDTGNYVEATTAVADFTAALAAANAALHNLSLDTSATELFAFQFDGTNGYLFNDVDSDGVADQVIVLVGITDTGISAADIII